MTVAEGIEGDFWLDGSFLTQNIAPQDVDFALRIDTAFLARATPSQKVLLFWLGSADPAVRYQIRHDYLCDSYVFWELPATHLGSPVVDMRQYWLNWFGFDRNRNPKGIAALSIPGGVR